MEVQCEPAISPASTLGNEDLGLGEPRADRVPEFSVSLPGSPNENRAASTPDEQLTRAPGCRCGNFGGTQFPCLVAANSPPHHTVSDFRN